MGAIHNKIKNLRERSGLTQQQIADRLSIHLKTWQKIENGITKLDIDRLKEIADILETTLEDLINVEDSVYISEIKNNDVGFNNSTVTIQHKSDIETQLFERIIAQKDQEIVFLRELISKLSPAENIQLITGKAPIVKSGKDKAKFSPDTGINSIGPSNIDRISQEISQTFEHLKYREY